MPRHLSRTIPCTILVALSFALLGSMAINACSEARAESWKAIGRYTADADALGGVDRYVIHLSTDKPIYRIGETVFMRAVILNARTHAPLLFGANGQIEVKGPKGDTVARGYSYAQDSVIGFGWPVPDGIAGGEYTAVVNVPDFGLAPAERKFDLRVFRAPRLKSQILFARDGYGPGDTVTANLHVERAEGGMPRNAKVTVSARVDDVEVYQGTTRVDDSGNASASFALPKSIERGEGTLAMGIEDGGVVETATKTIPILLQTLDIQMFPESGDLVAGLPTRLYVEAKTPAKKPADLEALVVDEAGATVAKLKTEHEGRGRASFTPSSERTYALKILAPSGIKRTFPLPAVKKSGGVIRAVDEIVARGAKARVQIAATAPGTYTVTLSKREAELTSATVTVGRGGLLSPGAAPGELSDVALVVPKDVDGVLTVTLWGTTGEPLAERLIFREQDKQLRITVKPDQQNYVPGGQAALDITTTNEDGKPVSAVVGVTVTDESVLEMIEKREQAPRLPVMVFLEPEVRELADAHVYLDSKNSIAPLALDLLLGTQGWRRFALKDVPAFVSTNGDAARRALAIQLAVVRTRRNHKRMPEARPEVAFDEAVPMEAAPPAPPRAAPPADGKARRHAEREAPRRAPRAAGVATKPAAPVVARAQRAPAPAPAVVADRAAPKPVEQAERKAMKKEIAAAAGAKAKADHDDRLLLAEELAAEPEQQAVAYVREYAHQVRPGRQPADRIDFAETLYWTAGVRTDASGKARVSFGMSDAVTAFKVAVDAFDVAGAVGSATRSLQSLQPFYIEPKVPLQLTSGDVVALPVAMVNGTQTNITVDDFSVSAAQGISVTNAKARLALKPGGRVRSLVTLDTAGYVGTADLVVTAKAGEYVDQVTRPLDVRSHGFPAHIAQGGLIEADSTETMDIEIPSGVVAGSLTTEVGVYPAPLGNLTQALSRLMQEPSGCFEQTSSTSYPLTMAQQYFTGHQNVDPELVKKSGEILQRGYQRLVSFECKDKGYEWFGGTSPGHEALTAYGLMQFRDMAKAKLTHVDTAMVERTRAWLWTRRDGKGGFMRNERALDSFGGAPEDTTNAYIVWALLAAGEKGLEKEIAAVKKAAMTTNDAYVMALGANVSALSGDMGSSRLLMDKLAAKQDKSGSITGAVTSITRSGGEALLVEATSLAVLAWLREAKHSVQVESAMKFLAGVCEGGRFSSTQATILALKAIIAYDEARSKPKAAGTVQLLIDGKPAGEPVVFTAQTQGALTLPSFAPSLTAGKHQINLRMTKGARMPYSVTVKYNALQPASSEKTKLSLVTALSNSKVAEGKVTEVRIDVANITEGNVPMPVAIIGIPGGLEVRHDQLKELVKSGKIAAYEVLGREVVLYWRQLKAKEKRSLPISCVAAIPGKFVAPASRIYEYYTDEYKRWVPGLSVEIAAIVGE